METASTIRAYQKALATHHFKSATSYSEGFAQARFLKKFQEPDPSVAKSLSAQCWQEWLSFDEGLPFNRTTTYKGVWYRARASIHEALRGFQPGDFTFPKGSSFVPSRGKHSIEARLVGPWTVTRDCFDTFASMCYRHNGLKKAVRRKYRLWFRFAGFDLSQRQADRFLYGRLRDSFQIFKWKLSRVVTFVEGSRFSTVPKNNTQRRPINVEPFGNLLVQSTVGAGIRNVLKSHFKQDLNTLQLTHRARISDLGVATIDLKNASDSISLDLCRFLLPSRFFELLCIARSGLIYGPDQVYHVPRKISSMGNGFTFELMTLILTAVCRELDSSSSVYGDDIIIERGQGQPLIELLEDVGFVVNADKSFLSGPFRESCGGNYHASEGYIKSFDFEWPISIDDCRLICNKLAYLQCYPSFKELYQRVCRVTPPVLQGGPCRQFCDIDPIDIAGQSMVSEDHTSFPPFFVTPKYQGELKMSVKLRQGLRELHYEPARFNLAVAYEWRPDLRSQTLRSLGSRHYAKYLMYLHAGRRADDIVTGSGKYVRVYWVTDGQAYFRAKTISHNSNF